MNSPRCSRCARTQPPAGIRQYWCAYCGSPLPQELRQPTYKWVAHAPPPIPGGPMPPPVAGRRQPYGGPPSYRGGHPRWGFPPVVWKPAPSAERRVDPLPPVAALRVGAFLGGATAVSALAAAAMETWRFGLLLRGRTEVLLSSQVDLNDALVVVFSLATAALALICAVVAIPAVVRAGEYGAARAGLRQTGSATRRVARLVVPGWNLYGAGEVLAQTDGLLRLATRDDFDGDRAKPGAIVNRLVPGRIISWWWVAWIINGALVVVVVLRGIFGRSVQSAADSVELHIALDLSASVVAGFTALVLWRFATLISPPPESTVAGWVVLPPRPKVPEPEPAASEPEPTAAGPESAAAESDPAKTDVDPSDKVDAELPK